jgi:hypothetical protein
MPKEKRENTTTLDAGLFITAKGLRGKQSVRATFRLPDHIIRLLGVVAAQLGLKQKSLFDQLVDDQDVLDKVADSAHGMVWGNDKRRQKTFVLSRRSLDVLEHVARQQNIPRDLLVEISIQRLLPVMNDEQKKHANRKLIHREMTSLMDQGEALLRMAGQLLGPEDQAYTLVAEVIRLCAANMRALQAMINKGRSIEEFRADEKGQGS